MSLDDLKYINVNINDIDYPKLVDSNNKTIKINTPFLYCPFGIDNNNGVYSIKLEFDNLLDPHQKGFFNLLGKIDNKNLKYLNCGKNQYLETVKTKKKHKDITIKFKTFRGRIITNVKYNDKTKYLKTIYDLEKKCKISCDLEIGVIWKREDNDKTTYGLSLVTNNIYVK